MSTPLDRDQVVHVSFDVTHPFFVVDEVLDATLW